LNTIPKLNSLNNHRQSYRVKPTIFQRYQFFVPIIGGVDLLMDNSFCLS